MQFQFPRYRCGFPRCRCGYSSHDAVSRHNIEVHLPTQVLGRTLSAHKDPRRPLGASRVTLSPSCAATEVHLPTPVLGRTPSPSQGPPNTLRCEESGAATSLRRN
ncbi:hypothetical protein E2C01_022409 [Portunus trituberculatus]|uniref:C2H2-type domain-containing protein n=1 Tax=Portunus trituberculatus TaxID=210409 RepID=A0A5B7E5X3_PORTR|nr:hypothetical protein [Portunus trituberculatus]